MKKLITLCLVVLTIFMSCNNRSEKSNNQQKLIIFHAGSLTIPFKEISSEFQEVYPEIDVILEGAGSRKCARKITDLNKECDIMASADYTVIDELLIPEYASWNIKFVTNEMTIAYHDKSKLADQINSNNWYKILLKDDVAFGRSDPDSDPCGYRSVLTSKLAEIYYGKKDLASKLMSKDLNYIRPKETDLLGLLESNAIDYIFLYRSVAEQHGLHYVVLPDSINLKNPQFNKFYEQATIEITGKKPGEWITKKGEPMVYGITILNNAPNEEAAIKFMKFLMHNEKGLAIMRKNGQPHIVPSPTESFNAIPADLREYALESNN